MMRLTTIFILLTACQLQAASSFGQRFTLVRNSVTISTLFKEIKKQTGYHILWDDATLKGSTEIKVNFKNTSINEVLDVSLKGLPVTYTIKNKSIILKPKAPSFIDKLLDRFILIDVRGTVVDEQGNVLAGATVKVKGTERSTVTNDKGEFYMQGVDEGDTLLISYVGYATRAARAERDLGDIILERSSSNLKEVAVANTGYQKIPKDRATGSFVLVDNTLLNRAVGTNLIDRLDGVTSGLIFNKALGSANNSVISIRGRSTIFANPNPLIVLDNFPYDGDLNNINPNDIENVTILRDAAAASIWGVKAGNGVIVITTKKGKVDVKPSFSMTSNYTFGSKPDQNYPSQMSSVDYIELEKYLYDKGYYATALNNNFAAISPAVSLMDELSKKAITQQQYMAEIEKLQTYDVRNQLNQYLFRTSVAQQHNLNISGGDKKQQYFISGGYDHNIGTKVSDEYKRVTFNGNNTLRLLNGKIELFTGLTFTKTQTSSNLNSYRPFTPYDLLADEAGNPLPVVDNVNQRLRARYVDTAGRGKLLDWHYRPLDDRKANRNMRQQNLRFLTRLNFQIIKGLELQTSYQYERGQVETIDQAEVNSFYTRDLINRFSSINSNTGQLARVIPMGDILFKINSNSTAQYGRTQLSYNLNLYDDHQINAIAGFEIKDYNDALFNQRLYGYDPSTAINSNGSINPQQFYRIYYDPFGQQRIPTAPAQSGSTDRYRSFYSNASYTYKEKYTLSASARKDQTNIFGVSANQKGVPLWSAGISWTLNKEDFYHFEKLPYLKLRATYGYNGNADKSTSAYLTAVLSGLTLWNANFAQVTNPPNPSLGWEKIRNINLGIDFGLNNNIVNGSLDYYRKTGSDLIGNSPIAPQTGVNVFRGNSANLQTNGLDVQLNMKLITTNHFGWEINTLYSYSRDRITDYKMRQATNGEIVNSNYSNPLVGYPYYAVFAFNTATLNASGNPQGYHNNELSTDYAAIYNSLDANELIYKGSAAPTSFGSIRNTLRLSNWSFSTNLLYKFGYAFRRTNVFSGSNFNFNQSGYEQRWQNPGDEYITYIPSLSYPINPYRDLIFQGSAQLVERADHIRLQDIRISYSYKPDKLGTKVFDSVQIYAYANNIGILWRANDQGVDPDAGTQGYPAARSFSVGINANF